jgi:hypothetical protein
MEKNVTLEMTNLLLHKNQDSKISLKVETVAARALGFYLSTYY